MKKFGARYSKVLLILLGVLAAIVIGFHSHAVSFDSETQSNSPVEESIDSTGDTFNPSGKLHFKLLSLLK